MKRSFPGLKAGRLWSLWDMFKFDAHLFLTTLSSIEQMRDIMQSDAGWVLEDATRKAALIEDLRKLMEQLSQLGLKVSLKKADLTFHLVKNYKAAEHKPETVAGLFDRYMHEVRERFEAELEDKKFYYIDGFAEYLDPTEPLFGKRVEDVFAKAAEDISEAGKCLALKRPTAAVFHLMRAMELAVQQMYTCLGLEKSPEREWGKLLSDMKVAIEAKDKGDIRDRWSASHSHLYHVKQAWRNDVMHPKQTYTMEEAKEVFDAVRSFMRHLSDLVVDTLLG